jgi:hypothetical protein
VCFGPEAATAPPATSLASAAEPTTVAVIVVVIMIMFARSGIHVALLVRVHPSDEVSILIGSRYIVIASLTTISDEVPSDCSAASSH